MYGEQADRLIQDSRRTANLDELPLYSNELVQSINREQREIFARLEQIDESFPVDVTPDRVSASALFVLRLCAQRNKRCLLAYEKQRADRLARQIWDDVPVVQTPLSAAEQVFVREYSDLVTDYKGEWSDIDLTGSLKPPQEMYVEIEVIKDAGEIQTEYGVFNFKKGSQFFLRTADVQRLVQQGFVTVRK